ncbi:DNA polymerase IV [Lactococcus formosensis]|jgi:Nucleotidyltransferase/DNA polymerase involved in DNA repair|uniref:DNA polymerase IV n=1 Tax=Lactococcus formosensis TaxID=1281486 RepID=A0A9Q9D6G0_9LACT|nr:DNA polymerase IV [Lactococcus formosensis]MCO7180787.1 DNA polymerase IV [Lactococcus formosensis]MDG6111826.1 DNA polymerase IV [Lactococcus formosensis]MDG6118026.1 DNA polymerase IV [Lactococcus formosensis]MDG6120304.1 DNA polymerase IV [Lactococcus formosensis]MDG6126768.1 DNA polymerase IV [Lactococcus formosensis]
MLTFPLVNDTSRKIIHIDMDAFFASVEIRDNPKLKGKPVVIARNPLETGGRGVVSTCSYEARAFGIHSAMSAKEAYDLCPQAVFISGNYEKYRAISEQVREIFNRYTDEVEAASIDEAYLDVTRNKIGSTSAIRVAKLIQHDIFVELGLTCSAGVSYNKFLAKIASDYEKPHGLTVIMPEAAKDFLAVLPVEKFHGVGKATGAKLHELEIFTGADIQAADPLLLAERFGVYGWNLFLKANGIHHAPVVTSRQRKSVGKEKTYSKLLYNAEDIKQELTNLSERVSTNVKRHQLLGDTVVLKLRYSDFKTITKRKKLPEKINETTALAHVAQDLLEEIDYDDTIGVRLLGVTLTGFGAEELRLDMKS